MYQQSISIDDSKICPLAVSYDADIHDALANLKLSIVLLLPDPASTG
jgi:hypothetical protein